MHDSSTLAFSLTHKGPEEMGKIQLVITTFCICRQTPWVWLAPSLFFPLLTLLDYEHLIYTLSVFLLEEEVEQA